MELQTITETKKTYIDNDRLQDHVDAIAQTITDGFNDDLNDDNEPYSAYDYLEGVMDIHWVLNNDKTYRGARLLVAFGGPNIWVDTESGLVEGYWWGSYAKASFKDNIGLDNALEELFSC